MSKKLRKILGCSCAALVLLSAGGSALYAHANNSNSMTTVNAKIRKHSSSHEEGPHSFTAHHHPKKARKHSSSHEEGPRSFTAHHHKKTSRRMALKRRAKYMYKLYYRRYRFSRRQSAVLTGLAMKEDPSLKPTIKQAGGGAGYGLYQITGRGRVASWCRRHHKNYKSINGQVSEFYFCHIRKTHFRKVSGLNRQARYAQFHIERSSLFNVRPIISNAKRVLAWTK